MFPQSAILKTTGMLVLATGLFVGFQNCAPTSALKDRIAASSASSLSSGSTANPSVTLSALRSAEQQVANAGSSQQASIRAPASMQGRAICAIRGGAGAYLARVDFSTQSDCTTQCNSFSATNPNRVCTWNDQDFFGDPTRACTVSGGAHAVISSSAQSTYSQCQASCSAAAAQHPYRICDWGTDRIYQPPPESECKVVGGAGKPLLNPSAFGSLTDCQNLCAQFQANTYRRCVYGSTVIQSPTVDQRCDIWGGAGKNLTPSFYGSIDDCKSSCASFTQNPNRICFYGKVRVQ